MSKLRKTKRLVFNILAMIAVASTVTVVKLEKQHFANHGHYVPYGWHVDVRTVTPEPQFAAAYPDPKGGGIIVPAEGQWTEFLNFTIFPAVVESCMSGKTHVIPVLLEKLDPVTGTGWTSVPPYLGEACLLRRIVIWPLESFTVPIAEDRFWFDEGDWVRITLRGNIHETLLVP